MSRLFIRGTFLRNFRPAHQIVVAVATESCVHAAVAVGAERHTALEQLAQPESATPRPREHGPTMVSSVLPGVDVVGIQNICRVLAAHNAALTPLDYERGVLGRLTDPPPFLRRVVPADRPLL